VADRMQNFLFFSVYAYYLLKIHLLYISLQRYKAKIKCQKIVEIKGFLTFLLVDGRIQIFIQIMTDPGGPKTYGSYESGSTTLDKRGGK
jgi:hypothetical protein